MKTLGEFWEDRAARRGHDNMLRQLPAQLLRHLEAVGLGTLGVIGAQIDVHESPTVFVADFAAEAVTVIIVSLARPRARALNPRADDFSLFQSIGDKNVAIQACLCGMS